MKIIGKEYVDYVSKKTNRQVTGYKLYMTDLKESVEGLACEDVFVSKELGESVKVSDEIELLYNKYGQVTQIFTTDSF